MGDDLRSHRVSGKAVFLNCAIMTLMLSWILGFNLVQILISWIVGLLVFLFFSLLFFISSTWDLFMNPWIKEMHFNKWNTFTTSHYISWLLEKDEKLWRKLVVFIALPTAVSVSSTLFDVSSGIALSLFSIPVTFLLMIVQINANKD